VISNFGVTRDCITGAALSLLAPGVASPNLEGVSFDLNEAAKVTLTIEHRDGSPQWTSCPGRHGHSTGGYTQVGQQTASGVSGHNGLNFASTSRHRRGQRKVARVVVTRALAAGRQTVSLAQATGGAQLVPGTYVVFAIAVNAAGQKSNNPDAKFWVIKK
jgi:hypothetical protein